MTQPAVNSGARPDGSPDESAAAHSVQSIFNTIAPTYDLLNHLMSMGLDRRWWNKTAQAFAPILCNPSAKILDICCGTGDQTAALQRQRPFEAEPITGLDFSAQMLERARAKFLLTDLRWVEGDAMHLPFADNTFDLVTSAFGFRNLTNYAEGLREIARVLKPGGQIGILECNQPEGISGAFYRFYLHHGMPTIGGIISGQRAAYRYLPDSIARFPRPPQMFSLMREAGFTHEAWNGYLLRSAGLYRATKA
ncbi:MAG: bifunctional demethylmenaquinone methyltransferase/2-methoxy-6-polyprenyl-1,4-benzoquinol methylase UbiE [Bryocella sp.]